MIWRHRAKQQPGLKGSGRIIDNIHWWYWDDCAYPGLIKRDRFEELCKVALSEEESRDLAAAMVGSELVSIKGQPNKRAMEKREKYFRKIDEFLIDIRERTVDEIDYWIEKEWDNECLDVFKAYLNVLEFWGYPYNWREIFDARCDPALIVFFEDQPAHCLLENDIQYIRGRPHRFVASAYRASWSFDVADPGLVITSRLRREDYEEGKPIVRKCAVGSRILIPTTALGLDELWSGEQQREVGKDGDG